MADFAAPSDIEAGWRPLTDAEAAIAPAQLAYASAIIRDEFPDIDARIAAGTLSAELVKFVARDMVKRTLMNPNGLRQEQLEDYSYTRDTAISDGSMYLTDEERRRLSARGRRSGSFSIAPTSPAPTAAAIEAARVNRVRWWYQ